MSSHRYPKGLLVSTQDFEDAGWREVLTQTRGRGNCYPEMWNAFSDAAKVAIDNGKDKQGKVLWLLADACSMMLVPSSLNQPFEPMWVINGKRSVIPDDLTEEDVGFLASIVDSVDDSWLKARLADLVWVLLKPRDVSFALIAIDAYRAIPLDTETWIRGGRECWGRAIRLAKMLKKGAGDRLEHIESSLMISFRAATKEDGFFAIWLAGLLKANELGKEDHVEIAEKLEAWARDFDDFHKAKSYFSAARDWYKVGRNTDKEVEMTVLIAESWVKEAEAWVSAEVSNNLSAAMCYENAIQVYQMIPNTKRSSFQIDERIKELRVKLSESGKKALGEMTTIEVSSGDISELIGIAREAVSKKTVKDALLMFSSLGGGVNVDKIRESVIQRMKEPSLTSLFSNTLMSRDGRKVAKHSARVLSGELTEGDEVTIRAEMVSDYSWIVNSVVYSCVLPALDVLIVEHQLREDDFIELAANSPVVPKDRARLWGKALYAGYESDFVTALHLLVPQVEHMVRVHLKQIGAITTYLDPKGIQTENGMSTLMGMPEIEQVFDKHLIFEIRSLFCDSFGPNLRNELAHGLLDEDACCSTYSVYAWWFALRLTFLTWWSSMHQDSEVEKVSQSS